MPKKSAYQHLQHKWTKRHDRVKKRLWENHSTVLDWLKHITKHFTVGSISSLMLFALPGNNTQPPHLLTPANTQSSDLGSNVFIISDLKPYLPDVMRPLNSFEEQQILRVIQRDTGFTVASQIDGLRLNRTYGFIGAEQHLARFPGDTMASHFESDEDAVSYGASGMAPGLGAWGYFASSQSTMTKEDILREKYYIAVQTFLSPNYAEKAPEYNDFYKFRKMLVVNPNNGKAIVTVIGDAGPAAWTGKHLGGSPEVMRYLERFDGMQRGAVLYFFLDDPNDTIPLGPVSL